jgi:hypothetical protein
MENKDQEARYRHRQLFLNEVEKMKKAIYIIMAIMMLSSVYSIDEVSITETSDISLSNGVCEKYSVELAIGQAAAFSIDGVSYTATYMGSDTVTEQNEVYDVSTGESHMETFEREVEKWKINDMEGEYPGSIFHDLNEKRIPIEIGSDWSRTEGKRKLVIDESSSNVEDCLGFVTDQYGNKRLNMKFEFQEGWNMIPVDLVRPHHGRLNQENEGVIDWDDILVEYFYNPMMNEYYTQEDIERHREIKFKDHNEEDTYLEGKRAKIEEKIQNLPRDEDLMKWEDLSWYLDFVKEGDKEFNYFSDNVNPTYEKLSRWVYIVNPDKFVLKSYYSPDRNHLRLGGVLLFKGWNFLGIGPEYVYNDRWQKNALTLDGVSGDCEIEKSFIYEGESWVKFTDFRDEDIGKGMIVKVSDDCRFGLTQEYPETPQLPTVPS